MWRNVSSFLVFCNWALSCYKLVIVKPEHMQILSGATFTLNFDLGTVPGPACSAAAHRRDFRQPAERASASEQNQRSPFDGLIRVRS